MSFNLDEYLGKTALLPVLPLITPLMIYERQFSDYTQSGLAEVSKTGPSRIYVVDPWSQIGNGLSVVKRPLPIWDQGFAT